MARQTVAKNKPVDIYVRVSQVKGRAVESEGMTAAEQERKCRQQADTDGRTVGTVFTDLDESGTKSSRPALDKLLARIFAGESGGVYCLNLSRFTRKADPIPDILAIEEAGAIFVSLEEKFDLSTAMGRAMVRFLGVLNALKADQAGEQFAGNVANAAARGIYVGRAPFGYERLADRRLVKVESICSVVAQAYRLRAGGDSWGTVARHLCNNTDRVFTVTTARNLLRSRVYMGFLPSGKKGEGIFHDQLAVVPRSVWEKAMAKQGPGQPGRRDGGGAPLAKILRCSCCGRSLSLQEERRDGVIKYRYYRCVAGKTMCAKPIHVRADEAEAMVLDMLFDSHISHWTQGNEPDGEKVAALEVERDDALAYVEGLLKDIEAGARIPAKMIDAAQRVLDTAQETLNTETAAAPETITEDEMREAYEASTPEERRALIRRIIGTVTVEQNGVFVPEKRAFAFESEAAAVTA